MYRERQQRRHEEESWLRQQVKNYFLLKFLNKNLFTFQQLLIESEEKRRKLLLEEDSRVKEQKNKFVAILFRYLNVRHFSFR